MPSYGRPEALERLLAAPGGWPDMVVVLVNEDDPEHNRYIDEMHALQIKGDKDGGFPPWQVLYVPAGSRFADAVRHAFKLKPNEPFYGIIDDDYFPVTPGWHDKMVEAAGPNAIAIANNKVSFPKLYTCRVMGGELARAIGTIAPGKMRHNFSDDTWAQFAEDFGLLRPLEDVIVEHRHHLFDQSVPNDATYERGSGRDFEDDRAAYHHWLKSAERQAQCERVTALLGGRFTVTDYTQIDLAILVPIQNTTVDLAFHRSFDNTRSLLASKGNIPTVYEAAGGSHIGKTRERLLWWAFNRQEKRHTHFLWLDDDMGWDPKLITRMIATDHDFVACAGVKKQDQLQFCFNPLPDPQRFHPVTGFMAVRHIGFAFVLIKRCVIEKLIAAYPDLQYDTGDQPPEWALFFDLLAQWPEKKLPERLSEDFSFCERWRAIGGDIWMDHEAALIHAGRKEYTGRPSEAFRHIDEANRAAG